MQLSACAGPQLLALAPALYLGQAFTHTLPITAVILPSGLLVAGAAVPLSRLGIAAWATSASILSPPPWFLLILQDLLGFGFWLAGRRKLGPCVVGRYYL